MSEILSTYQKKKSNDSFLPVTCSYENIKPVISSSFGVKVSFLYCFRYDSDLLNLIGHL